MPLFIRDTSVVPRDDWNYTVPESGLKISVKNYATLYPEILKHCKANGITPPSEQDVIKSLCERLHIPCYEGTIPFVNKFTLNTPAAPRLGCCGRRTNET